MNIDTLIKQYFGETEALPVLEMFNSDSIHTVYNKGIINILNRQPDVKRNY